MRAKAALLLKVSWTTKDIQAYLGIGRDRAIKLRNKAIEEGGAIPYKPYECKVDTVLSFFGTSREQELKIIKEARKWENMSYLI